LELVSDEFVTSGRECALLWTLGLPVGSEAQKIRP
jgi:hypothetical protein